MIYREEGQILPGLAVLLGVTLALGVVFFQVGKASVFRSEAQNAADAAALAGVKEIKRQLMLQWSTSGTTDLAAIDQGLVVARMGDYARRNDGRLVKHDINGVDVKAWTASADTLGKDARPTDREDFRATAKARARLELGIPGEAAYQGGGGGTDIGPVPTGGTPRISKADWKDLEGRLTGPSPQCPDVVTLGLFLKSHGFMVWQNADPRLGGDAGHEDRPNSWHRKCDDRGALDVNFGPGSCVLCPTEANAIDPLIEPLRKLGFRTIWRDGGEHDNHLHVDVSKTASIGAGTGGNMGGFAGPLEDALLDVRLIDWEAPVEQFGGGLYPATSGFYGGPPDMQIVALMCRMAKPYGPKILLATFETAIVESGIHNLNYGDANSHGVFQQQWTTGWGTLADTLNPVKATQMFLDAAAAADRSYPGLSAGQLAAVVQRPREDLRGEYEKRKLQAQALIEAHC